MDDISSFMVSTLLVSCRAVTAADQVSCCASCININMIRMAVFALCQVFEGFSNLTFFRVPNTASEIIVTSASMSILIFQQFSKCPVNFNLIYIYIYIPAPREE